ncbi:hypothetical protein AaE_005537, partial [Aphanomyces astaci]
MDRAHVQVAFTTTNDDERMKLYSVDDNCYGCIMQPMTREDCDASRDDCADLAPNENYTFVVQTVYPFTMELRNLDGDKLWVAIGITFDEHGNYSLVANRP